MRPEVARNSGGDLLPAPRYPDDLHKNLEMDFTAEELDVLQSHYLKHMKQVTQENPDKSVKVAHTDFFILIQF